MNKVRLARWYAQIVRVFTPALLASFACISLANADSAFFSPGNLLLSRTVYDNNPNNVTVGQPLPPNCVVSSACTTATSDGTYPTVFNNVLVDGSFGVTARIFLDQMTSAGDGVNSLEVPNSSQNGVPSTRDQLVTSFNSKSELALNLSTDHQYVTFLGYLAPIDTLDASNSNTPGAVDPTNPVGENFFRAVARVDQEGKFKFTKTNAYSGNNGRAALLNNVGGDNFIYTAGNAGNGSNPQPDSVILAAGLQIMDPQVKALVAQDPGLPTPVGSFNITQVGYSADKIGKDTNFRGLTVFNNVLYTTKGSGSNGINTVYFVDTTGSACTNTNGQGVPGASATLPASPIAYTGDLQMVGVFPYNMCILNGFNTLLAKNKLNVSFPFGIWFANATTLYVADEGNGDNTFKNGIYTKAAAQTLAGLQKWIFNSNTGSWSLAYTLQAGLNLGMPYTPVGTAGNNPTFPTGDNPATNLPWSPATDGLRNIIGVVDEDGTATIYAITSTVSGLGDSAADPNKLVVITDNINATALPTSENFTTLRSAKSGEALRGISFTPGS